MKTETIKFNYKGKKRMWSFCHNIEDVTPHTLFDAFFAWSLRAQVIKPKFFINYLKSKNTFGLKIEHVDTPPKEKLIKQA